MVDEVVGQVKNSQLYLSSGKILPGGPGIVVFSPSLEVLHMNCHAQLLISGLLPAIPEGQQATYSTGVLPPALINLADEIIRVLRSRHVIGEKGQLEIRRSASGSGNPVRIRGVGVPNERGIEHAHIVLLLTEESAIHSESH